VVARSCNSSFISKHMKQHRCKAAWPKAGGLPQVARGPTAGPSAGPAPARLAGSWRRRRPAAIRPDPIRSDQIDHIRSCQISTKMTDTVGLRPTSCSSDSPAWASADATASAATAAAVGAAGLQPGTCSAWPPIAAPFARRRGARVRAANGLFIIDAAA
jgi:hypothetical protein